jgi:hypothetical protein
MSGSIPYTEYQLESAGWHGATRASRRAAAPLPPSASTRYRAMPSLYRRGHASVNRSVACGYAACVPVPTAAGTAAGAGESPWATFAVALEQILYQAAAFHRLVACVKSADDLDPTVENLPDRAFLLDADAGVPSSNANAKARGAR